MGQRPSQPERRTPDGLRRNPSVLRRALHSRSTRRSQDGLQDVLLNSDQSSRDGSNRQRLCRLLGISDRGNREPPQPAPDPESSLGPALLHRTRSRFHEMLRRDSISAVRPPFQHRISYLRSTQNSHDDNEDDDDIFPPPRLPSIDVSSNFDHDSLAHHSDSDPPPRAESSHRRHSMRLNPLRPDRSFRQLTSSLRRRRSPPPSLSSLGSDGIEDQATLLSRILSAAAAATAATLMGSDHLGLNEARSLTGTGLGDLASGGEDGSFDGFLRALENGRIASALRQGGTNADGSDTADTAPLNIFRMFRFGSTGNSAGRNEQNDVAASEQVEAGGNAEGRMVPVIIVGIRSISPGTNAETPGDEIGLPPFIDSLGNFPSPLPSHALGTHAHDSIDSILRPPQNSTSFRHRRRASMGAFGMGRNRLNDRMDDQRDHRSPDRRRERPWSMASSSSTFDPRPPPATPASPSPELSRIPSRNSTPGHSRPASMLANTLRDLNGNEPRRNSMLQRASTVSPLSSHTEETTSLRSSHSATNLLGDSDQYRIHRRAETAQNVHYPRFSSGHPRRNGVVEPDHLPSLSRASTSNGTDGSSSNTDGRNGVTDSRSWIIYVLGGSYPENHPIVTTPSLFTENPTYEDMMLLSALLGPARAPVATEEDVQSAGGVYDIRPDTVQRDASKTAHLVAVAVEGDDLVVLDQGHRCLVCLCDFEAKEVARKLAKCKHLFHKECIDQWLTTGRNSCPLCREQGVDEKKDQSSVQAVSADDDLISSNVGSIGNSGSRNSLDV